MFCTGLLYWPSTPFASDLYLQAKVTIAFCFLFWAPTKHTAIKLIKSVFGLYAPCICRPRLQSPRWCRAVVGIVRAPNPTMCYRSHAPFDSMIGPARHYLIEPSPPNAHPTWCYHSYAPFTPPCYHSTPPCYQPMPC